MDLFAAAGMESDDSASGGSRSRRRAISSSL
jgi:hypothetical protein